MAVAAVFPRLSYPTQFLGPVATAESSYFRAGSIAADDPFGQGDVGMMVAVVSGGIRSMERVINGAPVSLRDLPCEFLHQRMALGGGQFMRKSHDGGAAGHGPSPDVALSWPALTDALAVQHGGP
ncbi:hypothetical protein A6A04_17030 [Paramagnetospirillum marisnigri]|uniref:Uncharacterized protein n=1 Tax=Paramagnetospirillum marisnigri TaxID=1285242 RepID=A0A178MRU7_9PROT|nr:hypothetical protein A6A04_17030 [Paramagnetospirillum marisnigri]